MPLIGMADPSHDNWRGSQNGLPPRWMPLEELLAVSANEDPTWCAWPYELIKAAVDAQQERDYISTTMLTGACPRSTIIERRENFIGDLDSLYAALRGTQIHRTLEFAARPGSVAEARFWMTFRVRGLKEPVEVSCSPDIVDATSLGDYKVTESPPQYTSPWPSHRAQVNVNSYIVRHAERWKTVDDVPLPFAPAEHKPKHLYLVYLGPKGPKTLLCTKSVPTATKAGGTMNKNFPEVWDDMAVEDYVLPRLTGIVKALAAYPEWPEDLGQYPGFEGPEGWACPGKPWCKLPDCLAKRWPNGLTWESPKKRQRVAP